MEKSEEVRQLLDKMFGTGDDASYQICDSFPDKVYVLADREGRHYQVKLRLKDEYDTWGLVCFSQSHIAECFLEAAERLDLQPELMSFDSSRALAQSKMDVGCLFLMDDPDNVNVHWVK